MIRRRPSSDEQISTLNAKIICRLRGIDEFWKAQKPASVCILDYAGGTNARLDLKGATLDDIKSPSIRYFSRDMDIDDDRSFCDDFLVFETLPSCVSAYERVVSIFPQLVKALGAYVGQFSSDRQVLLSDWKVRCLRNPEPPDTVGGRANIQRIWPVVYADDLLCHRTFGLNAAEVVRRAAPACHSASVVAGGAYLVVTTKIVSGAEALDALHTRIVRLIQPGYTDYITRAADARNQGAGGGP